PRRARWGSQTLLHVNQWEPEGEAEFLLFGQPDYHKDVSQMIMNLAITANSRHKVRGWEEFRCFTSAVPTDDSICGKSIRTQVRSPHRLPPGSKKTPAQEGGNQRPSDTFREAATQRSPNATLGQVTRL
ncbi:hypothetical protein HPG69_001262, partial [Diceros bicornis minor]